MPDPLELYVEFFPQISSVRTWDWDDGDAQYMNGVSDGEFDFVHSSHCLEHLEDPFLGLHNWVRICRPGGFLVITVPDEDLYEQGVFPSTFNADHKWTFTINKMESWCQKSIRIFDLVDSLAGDVAVERVQLITRGYRFDLPRIDQTMTPVAEAGIEVVLRRRPVDEVKDGRLHRTKTTMPSHLNVYFNQYKADWQAAKLASTEPFSDFSSLE